MFARRTAWELHPNRLAVALEDHRRRGRDLLDLTVSNPTECGFCYDESQILSALANRNALQYQPDPKGLLAARAAVAAYYGELDTELDVEDLLLTTSTSEAYSYVLHLLCDPGDELLVPAPSYPLFEFLAGLQDVKLRSYPLFYDHGWHIDLHALETAVTSRTRAVVVVHPNNPTGSYAKSSEAAELSRICLRHDLALVVDEVFLDYALEQPQPSFARNTDALTFTLSGISKICALPQMKLAWLAVSGPAALKDRALERLVMIADTYLSMNAPIQLAAPVLLEQRSTMQKQLMARTRANLDELDRRIADSGNLGCSRLVVEGGWYAVLRVPATCSDEDRAVRLLQRAGVLVQPGYFYDFPGEGYLVLSLITPETQFHNGITRILEEL